MRSAYLGHFSRQSTPNKASDKKNDEGRRSPGVALRADEREFNDGAGRCHSWRADEGPGWRAMTIGRQRVCPARRQSTRTARDDEQCRRALWVIWPGRRATKRVALGAGRALRVQVARAPERPAQKPAWTKFGAARATHLGAVKRPISRRGQLLCCGSSPRLCGG